MLLSTGPGGLPDALFRKASGAAAARFPVLDGAHPNGAVISKSKKETQELNPTRVERMTLRNPVTLESHALTTVPRVLGKPQSLDTYD